MRQCFATIGMIAIIAASCVKTEPVSPVPEVKFKSIEVFEAIDSLGNHVVISELKFHFIDGDADFGLETPFVEDSSDLYNYNVFLIPYEKIDTFYVGIKQDTLKPPPFYRIMRDTPLDRVGQNKTIQGTISIDIQHSPVPDYDTMRYDFYIVDRAFHKSNLESTADFGFR